MKDRRYSAFPVLEQFQQVAEVSNYVALPDDWQIGVSDVVDSTAAIAAGRYKAVNLAGAGTISAVSNALNGGLRLFIFGGDGARFVVPPDQAQLAGEALSRVAMWARRDLDLDLRVGMVSVADVRAAGFDVRAAFWQASDHVRYAMFTGGGLEWAETQLKAGAIGRQRADPDDEPDLTGLSCQWGAVQPRQGTILSLIVKCAPGASQDRFSQVVAQTVALLEASANLNPVPDNGPNVRWPSGSIGLQSRIAHDNKPLWWRRLVIVASAAFMWVVFKLGIRLAGFEPTRYRREIALNTDFRKFDDALMMTVDCPPELVERLRVLLDAETARGTIRYGLHTQEEALMTCVVPSVLTSDHMHFVDGAGGGYAAAADQLRQ